MNLPAANYNYVPYFRAVCSLPADVKASYLKALRVASIIVTQNLTTREQIHGVLVAEHLTRGEIDRLWEFFPDGVLSWPE